MELTGRMEELIFMYLAILLFFLLYCQTTSPLPVLVTDVDECSEPVCDQNCNNTIGSFYCTCNDGFYLDAVMQKCRGNYRNDLIKIKGDIC